MKTITEKKYRDTLAKSFDVCGVIEAKLVGDWIDARYALHVTEEKRAEMWKVIEALRTVRAFASKTRRLAEIDV